MEGVGCGWLIETAKEKGILSQMWVAEEEPDEFSAGVSAYPGDRDTWIVRGDEVSQGTLQFFRGERWPGPGRDR
jgi:hypothetical protein